MASRVRICGAEGWISHPNKIRESLQLSRKILPLRKKKRLAYLRLAYLRLAYNAFSSP